MNDNENQQPKSLRTLEVGETVAAREAVSQSHDTDVIRCATFRFQCMELGESSAKRGLAPHNLETAEEAHRHLSKAIFTTDNT